MKRFIIFSLVALIMLPTMCTEVKADDELKGIQLIRVFTIFKIGEKGYKIVRDKMETDYDTDTVPYIKNNRTMLPIRSIAEALQLEVNFDKETRMAIFSKPEYTMKINIDDGDVFVNDKKSGNLKEYMENVDGRLYIAVSKVNELLKDTTEDTFQITWNPEEKEVYIYLN
ncbi:MAG: copper amine oxidase N-terminal domain-containing protein [Ezakiella sp.]|nr:copper amine oxidase N-terminal domain-containing protein [Ezakiella sp.]MDD7471316.1 copper amine oxidase N-terminal domain-containing protein [Bacillota bacterium]MDY3923589.1 copper amine oxidase N-terminal domain-containing protein [Ezakiella sp.]